MNIEKIIENIIEKKLGGEVVGAPSDFAIGEKVFIRTVTYHHVGEIVDMSDKFVTLRDSSWIASSGRWNHALKTGELDDIEPTPGLVRVAIASIVDVSQWKHVLPTEVK